MHNCTELNFAVKRDTINAYMQLFSFVEISISKAGIMQILHHAKY